MFGPMIIQQQSKGKLMFAPMNKAIHSVNARHIQSLVQDRIIRGFDENTGKSLSTMPTPGKDESWLPIVIAASSSFFIVLVIAIILMLCCKRKCCFSVEEGRRKSEDVENGKHQDFIYQPVEPMERMTKHKVQPYSNTLYTISGSPPKPRKWSKDKKRNLYQQRVGSQTSLVLDLTPLTQSTDLEYHIESSPTEDVLADKSKLLSFTELKKVLNAKKALYAEFWSIPPNTTSRKEKIFMSSLKNRYPDIIPNTKSAVTLQQIGHDPYSTYINANYIKGYNQSPNYFIATEGPLQNTIPDFWRMIWENKCPIIVMITSLKQRNEEKCTMYWPSASTQHEVTHGLFTITYHSDMIREGYRVTKMYIKQPYHEPRLITHYWLASWPDHEVPKTCHSLLAMVEDYRRSHNAPSGPTIVHCSAGRGRTGCFIAISIGMDMIENEAQVDILKIVSTLRIDRGGMVEKDSQYIFIHVALYEHWRKLRQQRGQLMSVDDTLFEEGEEAFETHTNVFKW